MKIGDEIVEGSLPYKIIYISDKNNGYGEPIYTLEPIHESKVFKLYKRHIKESDLIDNFKTLNK